MKNTTKVTARFAGRRAYEITVKEGERKVRRIIYIPLINASVRFSKEIYEMLEELLLEDYNVSAHDIYVALKKESEEINHSIPNLIDSYEMDLY